ncbi:uncharacterized protein EI90DRAFT_3149527 [Cantharellus anzutake]|uniref:uncharacterized protein n=1 Tax=Cantharellus anzutake TaxID=1750568 RepID=UPI00190764BC|nr:uncharacterized protein EI90DRAFT_3149527 [Cantharellus anzutake]KAF8344090.1 hypothetical protein EI90DRAFT_3149527 [Cantharellus anzutake]
MDVDPEDGAARDDRKMFDSRVILAIDNYRSTNPEVFGEKLGTRAAPKLLHILLSTHSPTGTVPDEETCDEHIIFAPNLLSKLSKAYRNKSFFELLNDVDVRPLTGTTSQVGGGLPASRSIRGLQDAFEEPYQGATHKLLIETLNDYWQSSAGMARPYNLSLSVIQSSGMGKSRMVAEASLSIFTIPINIREELGHGLKTYPPPDTEFRRYFQGHHAKSDLRLQAEYAIILSVLFTKAAALLETLRFKYKTGAELAYEWAEYLDEGRTDTEVGVNRKVFLDSVVDEARKLKLMELQPDERETQTKLEVLNTRMRKSCDTFVKAMASNDGGAEVKCIIYFDEAHQLTELVPREKNTARSYSPYHNLGTVLSELTEFPVFFIFLSTSSHLQKSAPSPASHPSVRISQGFRLFPPFTELPFDIFAKKVFQSLKGKNKKCSLENVGQTDVMVGFGRSLWYVHHKNWLERGGLSVIPFARDKLMAQGDEVKVFHSRVAALGVRIGITFDNTTQASRITESELVESHMRVVYAIPEHREFMHTGSPSEPILAEAAARCLNDPLDGRGIELQGPEILAQACEKGLLAKGERGELCGRLLVTIAHDIALKQSHSVPKKPSPDPYFHRPVPVVDFLKALFAKPFDAMVLEAKSVTAKADIPDLQTAFANAYVFFSHFALAKNSEMLSAPNLAVALLRGMALQAKDNQKSIDAVIPVHMRHAAEPISLKSTSVINLQFKNREEAEYCRVSRGITVPDNTMPVISIIFELGDREMGGEGLVTITHETHRETRGSKNKVHPEDHHYEIVAYGCTSKTFAAVSPAIEPHYQSTLAVPTIVEDFPRATKGKSLEAFENLKPFFDGLREFAEWSKQLESD